MNFLMFLKNKNGRIITCQIAPAIRINTAEALGVPAGEISTGKIITALKMLGFDSIFILILEQI